jgi:hypothetical protein
MSGADFLDDEALEAAGEDRDERDCNESNEVLQNVVVRVTPKIGKAAPAQGFPVSRVTLF